MPLHTTLSIYLVGSAKKIKSLLSDLAKVSCLASPYNYSYCTPFMLHGGPTQKEQATTNSALIGSRVCWIITS